MTDRELIHELNNLKSVKPDYAWFSSNRELLLTQISNSGAEKMTSWRSFVINCQSFLQASMQPAAALGAFVLLLLTGSFFGHQLFNKAKPNDSLYIARVISERAKLTTIFDSQERDKMAVKFAADNAKDIVNTLADPAFNNEENHDQIAKLNENLNKELATVRTKLNAVKPDVEAPAITLQIDEPIVAAADASKTNSGLQIDAKDAGDALAILAATQTPIITNEATSTADKILDEATKLLDNKDYGKVLEKLEEVNKLIK